jgi:hypothetical protein
LSSIFNKEKIIYKTAAEIEMMREAALVVSRTLGKIAEHIGVGVTPLFLEEMADEYIKSQGAISGFKGLYGCPSTLLISVNEQVVHGLPTDRPFQDGDVVSVDCGAILNGFYGDHAYTFEIGNVKPEVRKLLQVTKECFEIVTNQGFNIKATKEHKFYIGNGKYSSLESLSEGDTVYIHNNTRFKGYVSYRDMFPTELRNELATKMRDEFEKEYEVGNYEEDTIFNTVKNLIESVEQNINEALENETIPFTAKEKETLKKIENVNLDTENIAVINWDSGDSKIKLTLRKKARPQMDDFVYTAEAKINNILDKDRTIESKPFKTEDDISVLNDFLSSLNINEEKENVDTTGLADKKQITIKDVNPEQLSMGIRVEYEHTKDKHLATEIALDHLAELDDYYTRLQRMEQEGKSKTKQEKKPNEMKEDTTKHTKTKWVNELPVKDGRRIKTELKGDVRIVYKTKVEKQREKK